MYPEILGTRSGLAEVQSLIRVAAHTRVNVLVQGETGTGKELIAHSIHAASRYRSGPFIVANCAAIPHDLMESEMFGHVRGAYTGAIRDHRGYFEAARGGTLLLDEIGDLHLDLQAKILHVVDSGDYRKVGSTRAQHHDARLVSATHQSLEQFIEQKRFRADLFYRLNVLNINVPPLRDRGSDVLLLADNALQRFTSTRKGGPLHFSPEATACLKGYSWPGNVRELYSCVQRLALLAEGPEVSGADVREILHASDRQPMVATIRPLAELEREAIHDALRHFGGNRTHAARALGISRRTLQHRLQRYRKEQESE